MGALLACFLAAVLANFSSLSNGFTYDDHVIVEQNPLVTDKSRAAAIWTKPYWGDRDEGGLFRPLTTFTYALNHELGGLEPFGFHLVNVLLHAAVSVLVTLAAMEFMTLRGALLAGLLFAVHPVHTEAVANVVGRAEILCALFVMAAWLCHRRYPFVVALFYFLALLAKENAILFPLALLFRDAAARRKLDAKTYVALAIACGSYLSWRHSVLGALMNPGSVRIQLIDNVIAHLPTLAAVWTALSVIGRYALLLVFPWRLSADYSYPQITAAKAASPWAWLGLLVSIGVTFLLAVGIRRAVRRQAPADDSTRNAAPVGLALSAAAFLPVSNLVFPIGTIMAERLLYLPSIGFALAVAAGFEAIERRRPALRPALTAAAFALILAGMFKSWTRGPDWKDDGRLHAVTVRTSPRSARAHYHYGRYLIETGKAPEGFEHLNHALELNPEYTDVRIQMGVVKMKSRQFDAARSDLNQAIQSDSTSWVALVTLAALEYEDGHPERALDLSERALRVSPRSVDAWFNLALARTALRDTSGAIAAWRKTVELGTRDPVAYDSLAWFLAATGQSLSEALRAAEEAVRLRPDGRSYDTLAEVHFRSGRWDAAESAWNEALRRGVPDADAIRQRLEMVAIAKARTGAAPAQR